MLFSINYMVDINQIVKIPKMMNQMKEYISKKLMTSMK